MQEVFKILQVSLNSTQFRWYWPGWLRICTSTFICLLPLNESGIQPLTQLIRKLVVVFFHCEETSVCVIVTELHISYWFKCIRTFFFFVFFFLVVVNELCVQALSAMWPLCELVWRKTHHACSEEQTCQCIEIWGISYLGQRFLLTDCGYVLAVCLWRCTTTPVFLYILYII